jgi:hypothetical protein
MAQWNSTLSEIQTLGFDFGARTISAGPTSKRASAEPALLAGDDADPFDQCYRREQQEFLGRALTCDLNHRLAAFEPSFGRALFVSPLEP